MSRSLREITPDLEGHRNAIANEKPLREVANHYLSGRGIRPLGQELKQQALLMFVSLTGMWNYALPADKLAREHPESILDTHSELANRINCVAGTSVIAMGVLYSSTLIFFDTRDSEQIPEELKAYLKTSASRLKDAAILTGSAISSVPLMLVIFEYPFPFASRTATLVAGIVMAFVIQADNTVLHFLPFDLTSKYPICRFPILPLEIPARKLYQILRKPPVEITNVEAEEIRAAVSAYLQYVQNRMIIESVLIKPRLTYRWNFHEELNAKILDEQKLFFMPNKPDKPDDNIVYLYQEGENAGLKYLIKKGDEEVTGEINPRDLSKRHYNTFISIMKNSREEQKSEEAAQHDPIVSNEAKKAFFDLLSKRKHIELDYLAAFSQQFPRQHMANSGKPSWLYNAMGEVMGVVGGVLVCGGCSGYLIAPINLFKAWTGSTVLGSVIVAAPLYFLSVLLTFLGYLFGKNVYHYSTHWGKDDAKLPLEFKLYPKTFACLMILNLYLSLYSYAAAEQVMRDNFKGELFDYVREPLIWIARVGLPFLGVNSIKDLSSSILRKVAIHFGNDTTQFAASLMTATEQMVRAMSAANPEMLVKSKQYLIDLGILEQSSAPAEESKLNAAPQEQGYLAWMKNKINFWRSGSSTNLKLEVDNKAEEGGMIPSETSPLLIQKN